MEKNTKDYNYVHQRMEQCLNNLNYNFEYVEFDEQDYDINYYVFFKIPFIKSEELFQVLLYADLEDETVTLLSPNKYNLKDNKNIYDLYEVLNNVNNSILHGKFSIKKEDDVILYTVSINCGEDFNELNEKRIQSLINIFLQSLANLLKALSEKIYA